MSLILKTWNVTSNRDRPGLEDFWVKWEKLDHLWVETDQWTVTFILNLGHRLKNTPQLQIVPAWALRCCYAASGQCRNKRNDKKVKANPSWGRKTKLRMEVKPYVCTAQICLLEEVLLLSHQTHPSTLQYILVISSVRAVSMFQTLLVQSEIIFTHLKNLTFLGVYIRLMSWYIFKFYFAPWPYVSISVHWIS